MPLVDFVALWVKKHVLSANLMDLLPCATEKVQMHLRATRLVEPPIPEIFIIHTLYSEHIIHGSTDNHGNPHKIYCLLIGQVGTIDYRSLLDENQVSPILPTIERKLGSDHLKIPIVVDNPPHFSLPEEPRSRRVAPKRAAANLEGQGSHGRRPAGGLTERGLRTPYR